MNEPESMEDLIYFTSRSIGNGYVKAWVHRKVCTQCKKGIIGKPKDDKGKIKVRATQYVCDSCGYTLPKQDYEDTLTLEAKYTCPSCSNKGEAEVPFIRKRMKGVETLTLECSHCHAPIDITKKMKEKNVRLGEG